MAGRGFLVRTATHDEIWAIQRELDFPGTVLGIERGGSAAQATARYAELFGRHRDDSVVG